MDRRIMAITHPLQHLLIQARWNTRPHTTLAKLLFRLLMISVLSVPSEATEFHVAPGGSDMNTGTSPEIPLASISKAIALAGPGDVINLHSGTYREAVTATSGGGNIGAPLVIRAYPGATPVIKASDVVSGWIPHEGSIWKVNNWNINSQQVFCDSRPLQQIGMINQNDAADLADILPPKGSTVSEMSPGSFHYDPVAKTLYVWLPDGSDPNAHTMEASSRPWAMRLTIPFVRIQDISFRHSNYTQWYVAPSQAAVVHLGPDSSIEDCDVQWGDFGGILLQNRSHAIRCNISNHGAVGIGAARYDYIPVREILVRDCVLTGNNYRGFSNSFHTGGIKLIPDISGTVEGNDISDNFGPGVWVDWCRNGDEVLVKNNHIRRNKRVGLVFEGSINCSAYNNLIVETEGVGAQLSGSTGSRFFNNTISKTSGYCAVLLNNHPSGRAALSENQIANNVVADNTTIYDLSAPHPVGSGGVLYVSDYNCFYRTASASFFLLEGLGFSGLSSWRALTGQDINSLADNPNFNLKDPDDFSLHRESTLIDAGTDIAAIDSDIRGIPRPSGSGFDIGAFEFDPVDSVPPSTPTGLTFEQMDWHSFSVEWIPSTDNVWVTGYDLYLDGEYYTTTSIPSFNLENLEADRSYTIFVIAVDSSGLKSSASQSVILSTGKHPDSEPPTSPTKLRINRKCGAGVQLTWRPSNDNVGVAFYHVYRNGTFLASTAATWLNDSTVQPGKKYTYRVLAIDGAGNQSNLSKSLVFVGPYRNDKDDKEDKDDQEEKDDKED